MITTSISTSNQFINEFVQHGRGTQFSTEGLTAMFDFFDEFSEDSGQDFKLDVIGLCCEFSEFTLEELQENYAIFEGLTPEKTLELLYDNTLVIRVNEDTVIIQDF